MRSDPVASLRFCALMLTRHGSLPRHAQASATNLIVPQASGGRVDHVESWGSSIGRTNDRTALPDDVLAIFAAGVGPTY